MVRDTEAEDAAREKLRELGLRPPDDRPGWRLGVKVDAQGGARIDPCRLARGGRRQGVPASGHHAGGRAQRHRLVRTARRSGLRRRRPRPCPQLLAALRRGDTMVPLGDGTYRPAARGVAGALRAAGGSGHAKKKTTCGSSATRRACWTRCWRRSPKCTSTRCSSACASACALSHGVKSAAQPAGLRRTTARLPVRRPRLDGVPARVRLRRLPGRRYGRRQNGAGAGACWKRGAREGHGPVAGGGAEIADVQLARRGGALHAASCACWSTPAWRATRRRFARSRSGPDHLRHAAARCARNSRRSSSITWCWTKRRP